MTRPAASTSDVSVGAKSGRRSSPNAREATFSAKFFSKSSRVTLALSALRCWRKASTIRRG